MMHTIDFTVLFQISTKCLAHQDSLHAVPQDEGEAVDLHGNQLGNRHHFSSHLFPLHILHLNSKGHQVGAL